MNENDYVSVAKILGFHGVNGEVRAGYGKNFESKLSKLKSFFFCIDGNFVEFPVSSIRFHKKYMLVKFKDFSSINDIECYKNFCLYVEKEVFDKFLEKDEFLVADLIGMKAYNYQDELIGSVDNVDFNGATNILSIKSATDNSKIYLVPFVKELVPEMDIENKKILINNIEGLLE